jgi:hypothetical protein
MTPPKSRRPSARRPASPGGPGCCGLGRPPGQDPRQALADVAAAYVGFAEQRPAPYEAMFVRAVDLPFATSEAPAAR